MDYHAGTFDVAVIGAGHAGDFNSCRAEVNSALRRASPAPAPGPGFYPGFVLEGHYYGL